MYGVNLVANLTDIEGHRYVLKIFMFVMPSIPIPFMFDVTDQRRLGFDLCLREQHSSPLRISAHVSISTILFHGQGISAAGYLACVATI